jgi:hypothetical protein
MPQPMSHPSHRGHRSPAPDVRVRRRPAAAGARRGPRRGSRRVAGSAGESASAAGAVKQRADLVRRAVRHLGEWPWEWTALAVEEFIVDVAANGVARSTIRPDKGTMKSVSGLLVRHAFPDGETLRLIQERPASRAAHDQLVALGFEGSVLKRPAWTYRPGRQTTWRSTRPATGPPRPSEWCERVATATPTRSPSLTGSA